MNEPAKPDEGAAQVDRTEGVNDREARCAPSVSAIAAAPVDGAPQAPDSGEALASTPTVESRRDNAVGDAVQVVGFAGERPAEPDDVQGSAAPTKGEAVSPDAEPADGSVTGSGDEPPTGEAAAEDQEDTATEDEEEAATEDEEEAATEDEEEAATEDEKGTEPGEDLDVPKLDWYILKVQVNREDSIRDALLRRVKILGLERYFGDVIVPTEDVAEFNKSGKRRIVKRKLYPGYILVHMEINDETWFLIRETPGVGDFTGSAGRPTPMEARDVERILRLGATEDAGGAQVRTAIPFKTSDRVRVKDGYFQNFEGEVAAIDHANGRITVMINIFGRSTPVELEHWQVESV